MIHAHMTEVIFDLLNTDEVYAFISKEDVKDIFASRVVKAYNKNGLKDDTYVSGELQFIFKKNTEELMEVLLFPCYEEDDIFTTGSSFANIINTFPGIEEEARQFLKVAKQRRSIIHHRSNTTNEPTKDEASITSKDLFKVLVEINTKLDILLLDKKNTQNAYNPMPICNPYSEILYNSIASMKGENE